MTKILKTEDFLKEMASYKTTYKKPFHNFLYEFDEYKDYVICKENDKFVYIDVNDKYCIIPFNSQTEEKCLPVVVWKNVLSDVHISSEKFIYNLETELRKMSNGTFEEFAKFVGRSYRYDVNIVVDNTLFINNDDFKSFVVDCFKKYNLTNKKRETLNREIDYVTYNLSNTKIEYNSNVINYKGVKWAEKNLDIITDIYGNPLVEGVDFIYPDNNRENTANYGILYSPKVFDKLVPDGWRFPSRKDMLTIEYGVSSIASTYGWKKDKSDYVTDHTANPQDPGYKQKNNNDSGLGFPPAGTRVTDDMWADFGERAGVAFKDERDENIYRFTYISYNSSGLSPFHKVDLNEFYSIRFVKE